MKCKKLAFINSKGGVGKSTSLFHVAGVLSAGGEKVLVIDMDKQGNVTDALLSESPDERKYSVYDVLTGAVPISQAIMKAYFKTRANASPKYFGVDVVPADGRVSDETALKSSCIQINIDEFLEENGYSWLLIDMPPSNKAVNEICFSQLAEFIIVPFSSDIFSVSGYGDLMDTVNEARRENDSLKILGVYLSRYLSVSAIDKYVREQLLQLGEMFIDIQIPQRQDVRESVLFGRPISVYRRSSESKSAYEALVAEIKMRINSVNSGR